MASPLANILHADPSSLPPLQYPYQQTSSALPPQHQHQQHDGYPPLASSTLHVPRPPPLASPSYALSVPPTPSIPSLPPTGAGPTTPTSAQASKSHGSGSLFQCADCLRRYSRPEHLQRHIATHTLGKRFTCDICTKAFSRADLLKRHRANHQDDSGSKRRRINSSPGAGRVAHACIACAKARVKCEEEKPCSRCRNRGLNCESASSEDAAMHLLHLANANGGSNAPGGPSASSDSGQETSPQSAYYSGPPSAGYQSRVSTANPPVFSDPANVPVLNQQPAPGGMQRPMHGDESQLPTPETLMEQSNPDILSQAPFTGGNMMDMTKVPFSDFLHDVLYKQSLNNPAQLAEAQGLAVLDYCDDANLELNDIDFGLLDHWNVDDMPKREPDSSAMPLPAAGDSADISQMRQRLVQMWTQSPWRWNPDKTDSAYTDQGSLRLLPRDTSGAKIEESARRLDRVVKDKVEPSARDKVLAIVLSACRNDTMMTRVASSFPSTDVIDSLVHLFLASHLCQVSGYIHYGSFSLSSQWAEWIATAAAAGAALAPVSTLRKFGFALQEAVRITIPGRFEQTNASIADIGPVQTLVLVQDIGLWSGNRRKMEIAECHLAIPMTMMRYRGKFQRSSYVNIVIDPSDEGKVLEEKWRRWYQQESWKRLAFHVFIRDAQTSMTQFLNPIMSYCEVTMPLPCAKELWFARTAEEFKIRYLELRAGDGRRLPSLGDLFRDISVLSTHHQHLDLQYSISIYLHGVSSLIWEYRQMNSIYRPTAAPASSESVNSSQNALLSSRHQELCRMLRGFQMMTAGWHEMLSAQEALVLNLLLMNLHVSLVDLELFSGKEGEDQARKIFPTLQLWSESAESRQAIWHAGQVLRQAKLFPPGHLKNFYAVGVHHAALCLWTHGIVSKAASRRDAQQPLSQNPAGTNVVYLDGAEEDARVQRFISYGHGRAAIRAPTPPRSPRDSSTNGNSAGGNSSSASSLPAESLLEDPRACMDVAQEILRANFVHEQPEMLPPVSENIVQLLKQLGNAAWAVGLG